MWKYFMQPRWFIQIIALNKIQNLSFHQMYIVLSLSAVITFYETLFAV